MKRQPQRSPSWDKVFAFSDRGSVVVFSRNESAVGMILRSLPGWILREADRWAEWKADCHTKHKRPWMEDYLPLPDPWQYLLDAPCVSVETKKVFRAAQSWLVGLRKLCRMATGFATLKTDWSLEVAKARKEGDRRREDAARAHIADRLVVSKFYQQEVRNENDPGLSEEAASWLTKRMAQITHQSKQQRIKAEAFEPILQTSEIEKRFPLEYHLVESWPCFPNGPVPGLMFWRNDAITKWVFALMERDPKSHRNFGRDYVKKTRQRLGLVPVSDNSPVVWDVEIRPMLRSRGLVVKGCRRDGDCVFQREFRRHP